MTPAARLGAGIAILDRIAAGEAAEKALTNWARSSRFAGSKDRAAIRDIVFDILRTWRSCAVRGGGETGRCLVLGHLRQTGQTPEEFFDGNGYAPTPLTEAEKHAGAVPEGADALDLPEWLVARFEASHGAETPRIANVLRHRAPVFLRVNLLQSDLQSAQRDLAVEGIETEPVAGVCTALKVVHGARGISRSRAFTSGLVDLQDAASQAVVLELPLRSAKRVLDYCAGGGGKALAMAALTDAQVEAHDADPRRMSDLPSRAARAGARITSVSNPRGTYDLVLCDAPCSGTGAFRRSPEGKWRLTPQQLASLLQTQSEILDQASRLVAPGGVLAYATCSILHEENGAQASRFLSRMPGWRLTTQKTFLPGDQGDGFFVSCLSRAN